MDGRLKRFFLGLIFTLFVFGVFVVDQGIGREDLVEGWDYNTSRDLSKYVISEELSPLLMPKTFCKSLKLLQIIVCSKPSNFEARNAIRKTWGSEREENLNVSITFLLGDTRNSTLQEQVLEESNKYKDLIQDLSFVDSYYNLTLKVVTMLRLVDRHCGDSTKYLMKIDDDMFLHVGRLVQVLKDRNDSSNILIGKLLTDAKPIRYSSNKWYAPSYMYPGNSYPNYLSGTSYLMSIDVVPKLYKAAHEVPIFHLEDVYITGMCAKKIDLEPRHQEGFIYKDTNCDACTLKHIITMHSLAPTDIIELYTKIKNTNVEEACRNETSLQKLVGSKIAQNLCI